MDVKNRGERGAMPVDPMVAHIRDVERQIELMQKARSAVMGLNIEMTEILLLPDPKEVEEELKGFERNLTKSFADLFAIKDAYFHDLFRDMCEGIYKYTYCGATTTAPSSSSSERKEREMHSELMAREDLWREFLGLYCSCLSMGAKMTTRKNGFKEACLLYERIIACAMHSGAYLNLDDRSKADGRSVAISRFRVRLASCKFSLCLYSEARGLVHEALLDFGTVALAHDDADCALAMSIATFLDQNKHLEQKQDQQHLLQQHGHRRKEGGARS
jgi:hypothetical protein